MKSGKALVFGIDGATFDIILPAIRRGKLPHLQSLIDGGSWGRLQSTIHPVTPMAWSSFATGANAGKHSIFDFSRVDGREIRLNTALDRKTPSIWTYLSQSGRNSIVLNVPFTYPPEKIRGIMIPGFDAPRVERKVFHPESVYDELMEQFGDYRLDWTFPIGKKFDLESYFSQVKQTISHRADTSLYLLRHHPWDFFMVVFSSTDHVQHIFWQYPNGREIIEETYEIVDRCLGRFLASLTEDVTVIVMSDHGAGEIHRIVYLDNWLAKGGYLKRPAFNLQSTIFRQCKNYLRKTLPPRSRKLLRSKFSRLRNRLEGAEQAASIDWNQTRAYSYGMYGNIYINAIGQDPRGIVEPRDYKALREQIATKLHELLDPKTGERIVERVYRKEELYSGPYTDQAPDLVVQWRDYAYFTKRGIDQGECVFGENLKVDASEYPHTGTHRLEGILIAKGPPIRRQYQVRANIVDLAPTILHILGEAIPSHMDGRVLYEIFEEGPFKTHPTRDEIPGKKIPIDTKGTIPLSEEEEISIRERLKSLGYLD
jgi:predicted AlkP superfamily phosphohydrolase/phosphomutase